ncbi:MAG: DUF1376 domain-containing protein [Caulobacteraceae bacterium]|nr:DUF1376 domain-containing protein [Caulobacteraceae bacterium]
MASPLPYMQFFGKDWLASSNRSRMPLEAQGAYIILLCYQWEEGAIPDDQEEIRAMIHPYPSPQVMAKIWPHICRVFPVSSDGLRRNPRCERDRIAAFEKSAKAKEAGSAGGKKKAERARENPSERLADARRTLSEDPSENLADAYRTPSSPESASDTDSNPSLRSGLRESDREKSDRTPAKVFKPPTQAEVYSVMVANHGLSEPDAQREAALFWGHYDGFGWEVNRNPIVNWASLVGKWITRARTDAAQESRRTPPGIRTPARQETASETLARRKKEMGYSG